LPPTKFKAILLKFYIFALTIVFAFSNLPDVFSLDFDTPIEKTESNEIEEEPSEEKFIEHLSLELNIPEEKIYNLFFMPELKPSGFGFTFETPPKLS
jgi:hypothetical protein